ncbi:MAG: cell wall-binding repeat-containing protein [Acidothermus cellulolyticus]|nr:cell wall-binding repeat-containing protein [Acidothermus cellulolyticus]
MRGGATSRCVHSEVGPRGRLVRIRPAHVLTGAVLALSAIAGVPSSGTAAASPARHLSPPAAPAPISLHALPATTGTVQRLAGPDRYATSAAVLGTYPTGVSRLFVATGATYPDALAAAGAAGAQDAVLLVGNPPSQTTINAVAANHPGQIILVGGPAAIPDTTGDLLGRYAANGWSRIAGADRYATAALLATATWTSAPTVYLASGESFADALTAAALAAARNSPVLLTAPDAVPAPTQAAMAQLHPSSVVIVGGTAAISDTVASEISQAIAPVTRIAGADRYATNALAVGSFGGSMANLVVASGATFPDAISGAALAGHLQTALLLVGSSLTNAQQSLVATLHPAAVTVVGGAAAISDAVVDAVAVAAGLSPPVNAADNDYVVNTIAGQVVRWNPCQPVGWQLNIGSLPSSVASVISTEVQVLAADSGLTLRYDGTTTFVPTSTNIDTEPDDLIVAVIPRSATDLFDGASGTVVGEGGWTAGYNANGHIVIAHGFAVITQDALATGLLPISTQGGVTLGTAVLHELGHAVGLNHASQPTEIMYPVLSPQTPATYSPSDRAGLAAVGAPAGCL